MNSQQYERLRENCWNRRWRGPARLVEAAPRSRSGQSPLAVELRAAAARLRRQVAAVSAWERVAEPRWLADASVERVGRRTLVIGVRSAPVLYEVRRRSEVLERALVGLLRGLRRVRFVAVAGAASAVEA